MKIKSYYERDGQVIYNSDCLTLMKQFPDKSFDLVLTDPPYGINFGSEPRCMSAGLRVDGTRRECKKWSNQKPKNYEKWDDIKPSKEIFDEILRISKNQIIWGGNYFADILPVSGGWLIWDKKVVIPTLSKCEMAWINFLGHIEMKHYLWAGFRKEKPERRYHTTQKPLEIILWCCQFLPKANLILDPFMGSGTTNVAAARLGRKCVGIEISEKYCAIAKQRIDAELNQKKLF